MGRVRAGCCLREAPGGRFLNQEALKNILSDIAHFVASLVVTSPQIQRTPRKPEDRHRSSHRVVVRQTAGRSLSDSTSEFFELGARGNPSRRAERIAKALGVPVTELLK